MIKTYYLLIILTFTNMSLSMLRDSREIEQKIDKLI